nr:MAG TPA: hypothetical protein [Caudoviricetes sp.]
MDAAIAHFLRCHIFFSKILPHSAFIWACDHHFYSGCIKAGGKASSSLFLLIFIAHPHKNHQCDAYYSNDITSYHDTYLLNLL